ncbi:MAG: ComF family protein [Methylovulum sp.]|uniref:ComF family protein n=1 Tax=Methylovulum sp. TaxID=1916980 RepID=UPI002616B5EC|nr:ComF family protein [Methylovulum sp.]MDD2723816.1 ComF family protein [Methylovulum sp.]MDD5123694.1 ComF family protein [Methylovulum sp.]
MNLVYNWLDIIQDYLLPPTCLLCGNPGMPHRDLCQPCHQQLPRNTQCCYQCADRLPTPSSAPMLCGRCLSQRPAFDETYAPFVYGDSLRYLVMGLKFGAQYKNARLLGHLLAGHLQKTAEKPELILPVPLHNSRYRQRGFNQAIEIARTVSKEIQVPLDLHTCRRRHDTPHQSNLTAKQRRKNIKNAFAVVKPITVRHVAVLDDVMTTGSTVHELAKVLKKAGVARVDVWVCARA